MKVCHNHSDEIVYAVADCPMCKLELEMVKLRQDNQRLEEELQDTQNKLTYPERKPRADRAS